MGTLSLCVSVVCCITRRLLNVDWRNGGGLIANSLGKAFDGGVIIIIIDINNGKWEEEDVGEKEEEVD